MPRRSTALAGIAFLAAASLVAGGLVSGAATAAPGPGAVVDGSPRTDARPSIAEALERSRPLDLRADDPLITFLAGLPRDRTALDLAATKASNPQELAFRDFMTLNEAGTAYGASAKTLKKVRAAAKKAGVAVRVDRTRLLARFTAKASVWQRLYGVKMRVTAPSAGNPYRVYVVPDGKKAAGAPAALKGVTVEWVATYAEYVASADTAGVVPAVKEQLQGLLDSPGSPLPWPANSGTLPADTCGQQAMTTKAVLAPSQIRKAYGSTALATRGMRGAGTRMAIISLGGGYELADIEAAAHCFGYAQPRIDVVRGTGVPEPFVNVSAESHLDLITASSVLPAAESLRLLEIANESLGLTDGFSLALDLDGKGTTSPDVISLSYGECEAIFKADLEKLLPLNDDILRMAALVGTSVVVAAGDNGTSMCGPDASLEDGPLVWYPASSPWVTAVGGTRLSLTTANVRKAETVWNDLAYVGGASATPPGPAGSGGPSMIFPRPWYQGGVTPTGPRALPDVSLLGAIRPGWPIYYGGTLFTVGGTSGGAPFLAANLALMAADQRSKGYPGLGFVNPWFYAAAGGSKSPFYDITMGGNAVQLVGCCSAYAGYDMASGLGVPDMAALYRSVPYPAG